MDRIRYINRIIKHVEGISNEGAIDKIYRWIEEATKNIFDKENKKLLSTKKEEFKALIKDISERKGAIKKRHGNEKLSHAAVNDIY